MTTTSFLRTVLLLWGDHWQPPLDELLQRHGHHYSRQQFRNWKNGDRRVPEYVEKILLDEMKAHLALTSGAGGFPGDGSGTIRCGKKAITKPKTKCTKKARRKAVP